MAASPSVNRRWYQPNLAYGSLLDSVTVIAPDEKCVGKDDKQSSISNSPHRVFRAACSSFPTADTPYVDQYHFVSLHHTECNWNRFKDHFLVPYGCPNGGLLASLANGQLCRRQRRDDRHRHKYRQTIIDVLIQCQKVRRCCSK